MPPHCPVCWDTLYKRPPPHSNPHVRDSMSTLSAVGIVLLELAWCGLASFCLVCLAVCVLAWCWVCLVRCIALC